MTLVCRYVKFDEEKSMRCSLERDLQLHGEVEIFSPKEEDNGSNHPCRYFQRWKEAH